MRKFSWYTIVHPAYEGWPAPPLYRLVGPLVAEEVAAGEFTCDIYFKPNRKGGHHHRRNYVFCSGVSTHVSVRELKLIVNGNASMKLDKRRLRRAKRTHRNIDSFTVRVWR